MGRREDDNHCTGAHTQTHTPRGAQDYKIQLFPVVIARDFCYLD